jgi:Raf kinase inhibitor-like YbhB/YbcL family protein
LIVEDPDAPRGTYTHWVAYNIAADKMNLPEKFPGKSQDGLMQGRNDFGKTGYGGLCPPLAHGPHRYYFKLFALDAVLDLQPGVGKNDVKNAI